MKAHFGPQVPLKRAISFPLFLRVWVIFLRPLVCVRPALSFSGSLADSVFSPAPHPFPHLSGRDSTLSDPFRYLQPIFRARFIHRPEDRGITHLWKSVCFSETTRRYVQKAIISYPPPWEPTISHITLFRRLRHWTLSWVTWLQSISAHHMSLISVLI
jgi:hypothetical protein